MYKSTVIQKGLGIIALCAVVLASAPNAFAGEATSSSFMTQNTVNSFGGGATSTNFSALQSADQVGGGESTSTSFSVKAGFLYFDSFSPKQQNWRWYDDEGNETPSSALADENVAPANISNANILKLRVSVAELAGIGADNLKFRVQFATSSDFSSSVFVVEKSHCADSSEWCYANGTDADNDIISTKVLSDTDACAAYVGTGCGTHNESGISTTSFTQEASAVTEYEFTIKASGAAPNTVYFFRLYSASNGTGVPLNTGESYPSLSSSGTSLTFTIDGLPTATVTSGIATTIDTTSTSVPFGELPISTAQLGAQRLTVTTNATQGYQVFTYSQQDLLGSTPDTEIPPVDATNQSPQGWSTACDPSLSGCYGYHTSDAVLAGGSTRFAANDTFAQFSTTSLSEVAFSSAATTSRSTDIVYKVEVRDSQVADSYSTSLVYIVVPTF